MKKANRLKLIWAVSLIQFAHWFAPLSAQGKELSFVFNKLTTNDGLSINSVIRTFQDKQGYIWICTRDGLNKYDGSRFRLYRFDKNDSNSLSSNDVNSVTEDHNGNIWVGTYDGLNRINQISGKIDRYYFQNDNLTVSAKVIKQLLFDSENRLWVSTNNGLYYFDEKENEFKSIIHGSPVISVLELRKGLIIFAELRHIYIYDYKTQKIQKIKLPDNSTVNTACKDSEGKIWIGTNNKGILLFNYPDKSFVKLNLQDKSGQLYETQIDAIVELDNNSGMLISSLSGLLYYNNHGDRLIYNLQKDAENNGLSDNRIVSMNKDRSGGIWLSSWSGGLYYINPNYNYFKIYSPLKTSQNDYTRITSMAIANNCLWMSSDKGLISYDFMRLGYSYYGNQRIESMYLKKNGDLLISISSQGIVTFNTKNKTWGEKLSALTLKTYARGIYENSKNELWIAPNTGECFGKYSPMTKTFTEGLSLAKGTKVHLYTALCTLEDCIGNLWIGTRSDGLYKYNPSTKNLINYKVKVGDNSSIPLNNICSLFEDAQHQIWVGTFGGGVCKYSATKDGFETFDNANGLTNLIICGIQQDNAGNIWVCTNDGVSRLDLKSKHFANYNKDNGCKVGSVNIQSFTKDENGNFFVGGSDGFVSFNPTKMATNKEKAKVVINLITYWEHSKNSGYIAKNLWLDDQNKEISLSYKNSSFSISFSLLNYLFSKQNQYAYKINEIDNDWRYIGATNHLNFNDLSAGTYTLLVKAANNDGVWNDDPASIKIRIIPPWWWAWYSKIFYTLLLLVLTITLINYYLNKKKLENDIKIKMIEKQSLEQAFQTRMRLFTNFSHELRTPLTLIIGPLQNLMKTINIDPHSKGIMSLMNKNANRLLLLVNQLMDFRKLEEGNLMLKCSNSSLKNFLEGLTDAFKEIAVQREITYSLECDFDEIDFWFDASKIEKVVMNLLSNAFKHSYQKGLVKLSVKVWDKNTAINTYGNKFESLPEVADKYLELKVMDTGHGVAKENIERIFDPFFQAHNYESSSIYGSGVGLNLTKGLVELHYGTIWAESIQDKETVFRVFLPMGNQHLKSIEIDESSDTEPGLDFSENLSIITNTANAFVFSANSKLMRRYSVLVIDDNSELRNFVSEVLSKDYIVTQAEDGTTALKTIQSNCPDLIISDVIMPGLNGFELCKHIKSDPATSHIPVILLTACGSDEEFKIGFDEGADDYIAKPFNVDLLVTRVENILRSREALREKYARKILAEGISTGSGESHDEKFMRKIYDYIKTNIDNPELKIEKLADDIGMDRSQLYRKIKDITDLSPSRLVMTIRIRTAGELLKTGNVTVSDACYKVGFNDLSYFGKCFRMLYETSPTDYMKLK